MQPLRSLMMSIFNRHSWKFAHSCIDTILHHHYFLFTCSLPLGKDIVCSLVPKMDFMIIGLITIHLFVSQTIFLIWQLKQLVLRLELQNILHLFNVIDVCVLNSILIKFLTNITQFINRFSDILRVY